MGSVNSNIRSIPGKLPDANAGAIGHASVGELGNSSGFGNGSTVSKNTIRVDSRRLGFLPLA